MRLPGGIQVRLALALIIVVGGALAAAFIVVVPSLEQRLVDAKLDQMVRDAVPIAVTVPVTSPFAWGDLAEGAAIALDSRVVIYDAVSADPMTLSVRADTGGGGPAPGQLERDPVALRAATRGEVQRGRVTRDGREYAEVGVPLTSGQVVLFSSSLNDPLSTVDLVERRLLGASAVALIIAIVLGTIGATMHGRRVRRLERAANRIAEGQFDEPIVDGGDDELGELAAAFDRMRLQLAQLDTARKEFVANASHELRTPLFSLGGFLELIADEDLDEETRRGFVLTMREQVERLSTLTADLLDLSRLDAGRIRVEREDVDLAETVRVLSDELGVLAEASGHRLETIAPDQVWALADEERVLQIARALAGNALVHTPPGTRVCLTAVRNGTQATIAVEDDGPGIPAEHQDRIFDRFYRVEGARTASGSGLGLAIASELADRMQGTVVCDSAPGRTVFTLELPAVAVGEAALRAPEPVA